MIPMSLAEVNHFVKEKFVLGSFCFYYNKIGCRKSYDYYDYD